MMCAAVRELSENSSFAYIGNWSDPVPGMDDRSTQDRLMAGTDAPEDRDTVANHTLAHLRSHGKKLDLILETLGRQGERLSRVERDVGEGRRDISEIKSDIALLENKFLSTQTEILSILYRLDQKAVPTTDGDDGAATPPTPSGSSRS
jgi:hypothetical protein